MRACIIRAYLYSEADSISTKFAMSIEIVIGRWGFCLYTNTFIRYRFLHSSFIGLWTNKIKFSASNTLSILDNVLCSMSHVLCCNSFLVSHVGRIWDINSSHIVTKRWTTICMWYVFECDVQQFIITYTMQPYKVHLNLIFLLHDTRCDTLHRE